MRPDGRRQGGPAAEQPTETLPDYHDERLGGSFWREIKPRQEPVRTRWFLPLVALLLTLNVPWYLSSSVEVKMFGGLPLWCWFSLGSTVGLAAASAFAAISSWRDEEDRG